MHRLAFWTLIPERLRYPVRCCGWWQWRPKEDGARGVHEVGGTAQRVEAKGEAARETVEEGARGEGRGHGASATRCYKGGYAAKSPQWAPRRLRRRIVHIRNGGTVIAGEHEAIHIIPRGPRLCCVFCDWSTTITDWRTEWRKGETRRSVCKGRRVASRDGGGLLEELGNVHASRAEIQVCLRIIHDNRFADNDRDYGKKKWWNLKIVANFLEFLNITSCMRPIPSSEFVSFRNNCNQSLAVRQLSRCVIWKFDSTREWKKKKERKKEDSRRDAVPKDTPNESFIPNVN